MFGSLHFDFRIVEEDRTKYFGNESHLLVNHACWSNNEITIKMESLFSSLIQRYTIYKSRMGMYLLPIYTRLLETFELF